jgi:large subunit ribosomal protein L6|tara:strand:- start:6780 stop:7313 length:534 start_codon:yes stop_codon:yes gene_type:complete
MSRIANNPVVLPAGVEIKLNGDQVSAKGKNGELSLVLHPLVTIKQEENNLVFAASESSKNAVALSGTFRSLVNNMVVGVTEGYERKLTLLGVGYRAKASGNKLDLTLGFSHPVIYNLPKGVSAETPSQTEIVLKSADKQLLGQVAAEVRAFRPPEPYKGKGVRYADEYVKIKEAKKK